MINRIKGRLVPPVLTLMLLVACQQPTQQIDTLISNAFVIDGSGKPGQLLDVGICADRICFVGHATRHKLSAKMQIDAKGLVLSPGFIDPHTHSIHELQDPQQSANLNYLYQGVTTVVNGNDGDGPVSIQQTVDALAPQGIGTNLALLSGHGSLRRQVVGLANRPATTKEIQQMQTLLKQAMQDGALGLSSGLYYVPGSYANSAELVPLARVAGQFNGIYDTHLRDESSFNIGFLAALQEAIDIAAQADVHLHVAHIKALGVDVWGQSDAAIQLIENAQQAGISISADHYPWRASGTFLRSALLPKWVMADSFDAMQARFANPDLQPRIRKDILENLRRRGGAESLLITQTEHADLLGLTLQQAMALRQQDLVELVIQLVSQGSTRVASFNMQQQDIENFVQRDWVVTSSDGTDGHPRKYASFPKKYQDYVLDKPLLSIERFVQQSTSKTAMYLHLPERGLIGLGYMADLLVFDPKRFRPTASFEQWNSLADGVEYLWVNGTLTINQGEYTGALAGQFIPRQ